MKHALVKLCASLSVLGAKSGGSLVTKALNTILFCTIVQGGLALAQDFQRAEVFGGYSYLNADSGPNGRQGMNGWEASFAYNVNPWLAVEGDVSGYHRGYSVPKVGTGYSHDYVYVFGPRFNYRMMFAHILFGADHIGTHATFFGEPVDLESLNGFAMAFGGGVQQKIAQHFAIRGGADWVFTHHNVSGGSTFDQNNFRLNVGIVYTFGAVRKQVAP